MSVPTEAEIRDAAQRLGLADENGYYPPGIRNKLAAAVQQAKQDQAAADDPGNWSTAEQLAAFANELAAQGIDRATAVELLLVEAARHVLRSQGLRLAPRKEATP